MVKGRRVPFNLQPKILVDFDRLHKEGHFEMLSSCSDEHIHIPDSNHSKEWSTIKLALVSKYLNKSIHKNKYQMANIDCKLIQLRNTSQTLKTATILIRLIVNYNCIK